MRWLFTLFALGLLSLVQAISSTGNRVLAVIEESEKSSYSQFWKDLEGKLEEPIVLWNHG